MNRIAELYAELQRNLVEMSHLGSVGNVLQYDMETVMPPAAADERGKVLAFLAGLSHDRLVSPHYGGIVTQLQAELDGGTLDEMQSAVVRHAWREYSREVLLPGDLVRATVEAETATGNAWRKGKKSKDSGPVLPHLERLVGLKRQAANLLADVGDNFYDALLGLYEPGMTSARLEAVFVPLRDFLRDLIRRIGESPVGINPDDRLIATDTTVQETLNRKMAELLGFDFDSGRLDRSTHPFTHRLHAFDTRITTRYNEGDLYSSLSAVMHEAGHGMYEQGLPQELYWTGAGHVPSLGLHESQSRLWENLVGRSRAFISLLCDEMSCGGIRFLGTPEELYRGVNAVRPSLIRVEADEVTYNLHIIMRFELERALIEGRLEVRDLRDAWNEKVRDYFGIEVPDDFSGFLQDTHWPSGLFGYFPTYTIGNLYSAQLYEAAKRNVPGLEDGFRAGEFKPLLNWLKANVFAHAGMLPADEIVKRATGSGLDASHWMNYIQRKYGELYGL